MAEQQGGPEQEEPTGWQARYRALLLGLFDIQFRRIITTQMVPTIYALGIILAGIMVLNLVASNFRESWVLGLAWLLLFGPAAFIAALVTLRISFEVILSFFRMAVTVQEIYQIANKISGQTDEIATDLPRIQFWKSRSRGSSGESD